MVDYSKNGNYKLSPPGRVELDYKYDGEQHKAEVVLTVSHGANGNTGAEDRPVLLLMNGTAGCAAWYHLIAEKAASWGYIVLQYDGRQPFPWEARLWPQQEVEVVKALLAWIEKQKKESNPPFRFMDLAKVVVAGHSRGGWLAALLVSDDILKSQIKACFLIDPVDRLAHFMGRSAEEALCESKRQVGILGAGVTQFFLNPKCANYEGIYEAAGEGSWKLVLEGVTHLDFLEGGKIFNPIFKTLSAIRWLSEDGAEAKHDGNEATSFWNFVANHSWLGLDPRKPLPADFSEQADYSSGVPGEAQLLIRVRADIKKQLSALDDYQEDKDLEYRKEVCGMASTAMLAWFHEQLEMPGSLEPFYKWIRELTVQKKLSFEKKEKPGQE